MLLITIVLTLWSIAFTAGLYVLALAFVSWLDREVTFKSMLDDSQFIDRQFIIDNFVK